ncbi:hypothetical protein [Pseudomonas sp.]|uniref:hypothetical protein n=1 Tax=Pseudomonas sp. TaxID=306 RepID=UPI003D6EC432
MPPSDNWTEKPVSALEVLENATVEQTIIELLDSLQETEGVLRPGSNIQPKLAAICIALDDISFTKTDLVWIHGDIAMDHGTWHRQTESAHELACIYAAMITIEQKKENIARTISAIQKAAYFSGLAAGYSHHRKTVAVEKARKAGLTKAAISAEINNQLIKLLKSKRPRNGWPGAGNAAKFLAPLLLEFITEELKAKKADLGSVQSVIHNSIENDKNVRQAYIKTANARQATLTKNASKTPSLK